MGTPARQKGLTLAYPAAGPVKLELSWHSEGRDIKFDHKGGVGIEAVVETCGSSAILGTACVFCFASVVVVAVVGLSSVMGWGNGEYRTLLALRTWPWEVNSFLSASTQAEVAGGLWHWTSEDSGNQPSSKQWKRDAIWLFLLTSTEPRQQEYKHYSSVLIHVLSQILF